MVDQIPKISIGLPVFNGGQFLEQAINSILSQTFTDFELIISDNASTDRTSEICRQYQAKDSRICYRRNETNIGAGKNFNLTFQVSRGKYFCWAGHDDFYATQFLEKCVEVLENDSNVVLCHTIIVEIDEDGKILQFINRQKGFSLDPYERFRGLAGLDHNCEDSSGLIRSDILRKTNLLLDYTDSDRTLLAEISLYGRFQRVSEPLFYKRIHSKMSTKEFPDWYDRMVWWSPENKDRIVFPHWLQFSHYVKIIAKAPIGLVQQAKCYIYLLRWFLPGNRGRWMAKDVINAFKKMLGIKRKG